MRCISVVVLGCFTSSWVMQPKIYIHFFRLRPNSFSLIRQFGFETVSLTWEGFTLFEFLGCLISVCLVGDHDDISFQQLALATVSCLIVATLHLARLVNYFTAHGLYADFYRCSIVLACCTTHFESAEPCQLGSAANSNICSWLQRLMVVELVSVSFSWNGLFWEQLSWVELRGVAPWKIAFVAR